MMVKIKITFKNATQESVMNLIKSLSELHNMLTGFPILKADWGKESVTINIRREASKVFSKIIDSAYLVSKKIDDDLRDEIDKI